VQGRIFFLREDERLKTMLNNKTITNIVVGLVLLVVALSVFGSLMPSAQSSGNSLTDSKQCASHGYTWNSSTSNCRLSNLTGTVISGDNYQVPLGSLFDGSSGVVFYVIMAGLLVFLIGAYINSKRK
jgi:hypothetical protein